ncbi:hypothetical protein [Candidatus Nanohalococcus occultus]|uniref:Uncharacterized protein n=1 Tax=Candidatus Nanohalococcus occultus TaxID=2978047 RepID=A0ABY8CE84_9ARCH|nr:hypothetical protein SVXNc_0510 [Candidatus Nanohaloarchaeota archaeon SVXNc]
MIGKVDLDREKLVDASKPLFYGYLFLAGITSQYTGTLLGLASTASLCFVSATLASSVEDDWQSVLDMIALITLLVAVSAGAFFAAMTSLYLP